MFLLVLKGPISKVELQVLSFVGGFCVETVVMVSCSLNRGNTL